MSRGPQLVVATLLCLALLIPGTAALPDEDYTPGEPVGAATVVAEVETGLDAILSQLSLFSVISNINKETFEQGETIELTLKDTAAFSCDDAVFVVEAYAPEPPSGPNPEIRTLDHLTGYDPIVKDQLVTADVSMQLPDGAEPGDWTIVAYTYCYTENQKLDSGDDIVYKTIAVEELESTDGTDDELDEADDPFITVSQQPSVSVSGTQVRSEVTFTNEGGPMQDSWIIELQPRPQGQNPLSVTGSGTQDVCDPAYPENVHTEIPALDTGESATLDLTADVEPGHRYDAWLLTGTGCADAGGEPAGPYPSGTLVDTVCVGDCSGSDGGERPTGHGVPLWALALAGVGGLALIGYGVYKRNE